MGRHLPDRIVSRSKQPYRAPNSEIFSTEQDFSAVAELVSENRVRNAGYFDPLKVSRLINKARRSGRLGERDNMAFIGILSTQAWHHLFVDNA
jgi:asparagine synthase (glutamine-hydrolysing)